MSYKNKCLYPQLPCVLIGKLAGIIMPRTKELRSLDSGREPPSVPTTLWTKTQEKL